MAGETVGSRATCLSIVPWSRTSHVVSWLTPAGKVTTVAKGAVRPKSWLLGQYDLNYTCDILYYARAKGEVHALRDCAPVERRDSLRGDFRALALAGYFRRLAAEFAPQGPECEACPRGVRRGRAAVRRRVDRPSAQVRACGAPSARPFAGDRGRIRRVFAERRAQDTSLSGSRRVPARPYPPRKKYANPP